MNFVTKNIMYLSMTQNIMKYITFSNIMFLHIKYHVFHNVFSCLLHNQRQNDYVPGDGWFAMHRYYAIFGRHFSINITNQTYILKHKDGHCVCKSWRVYLLAPRPCVGGLESCFILFLPSHCTCRQCPKLAISSIEKEN